MGAAFYDGGSGYEGELCFLLQFRNGDGAAVAHGGFDLGTGLFYIFLQRACIGNVGIHPFFKGQLLGTVQIVAAPVSCAVGTFAPVFLDHRAAYGSLLCGGFVETGEISAQHDEVSAHGQGQGDVVVVNDAAVGAYRYVNACFLVVFISGLAYFDEGGSLAAADALCFTGDADGTAADAYLYEVSACFGQEEEAVAVYYVAGAYSDLAVVFFHESSSG